MATVYKVKIVSHWINYTVAQLKAIIENAIQPDERDKGNTVEVYEVERT